MAASAHVDPEAQTDAGKEEYSIVHFRCPKDDGIKKISIGHIYKQPLLSRFNFRKPYKIITRENNLSINNYKDIYLLSRDDIRSHRSKYQFLHIGLVQVSMDMPFAITSSVTICLIDSKYPNFQDSVLLGFKYNVVDDGSIKFNWFPNFSAPLSDLANSNALVVTIDPHHSLVKVRYRVCYKLMKTSLKPGYLFENPVLEVDTEKTTVVPRSNLVRVKHTINPED